MQASPQHTVVEPFQFARTNALSSEGLRAFKMLNEIFARNLSDNLGAWLRSSFEVTLAGVEQTSFGAFLKQVSEPCYAAALRLEPYAAPVAAKLEISVIPPLVDLLLGGPGNAGEPQQLTDIEESILRSVMENVCRDLSQAWEQLGVEVAFDRRQLAAQMSRLMPATERALVLSFDVRMKFARGTLWFALPVVHAHAMLLQFQQEDTRGARVAGDGRARMEHALSGAVFGASLELPPVRLAARAVADLSEGDLLLLPLAVRSPARLVVGGETLFSARPARLGEHRAAHLDAAFLRGQDKTL